MGTHTNAGSRVLWADVVACRLCAASHRSVDHELFRLALSHFQLLNLLPKGQSLRLRLRETIRSGVQLRLECPRGSRADMAGPRTRTRLTLMLK